MVRYRNIDRRLIRAYDIVEFAGRIIPDDEVSARIVPFNKARRLIQCFAKLRKRANPPLSGKNDRAVRRILPSVSSCRAVFRPQLAGLPIARFKRTCSVTSSTGSLQTALRTSR